MYSKVYATVLNRVKPSKAEQQEQAKLAKQFLEKLNKVLENFEAHAILGGSSAKDTWLSNNKELDIFVQFPKNKYKTNKLTKLLEQAAQKAFPKVKRERLHGSRDYFQLNYKGFTFELVPIIKISKAEQALNITDISPLHAQWVNKNGKKIKDEIRLAKQFAKAQQLYGAESYISGFSGYILEILTIYYNSFEDLLKAATKWKAPVIIDPEKHYKKSMVMFELNKSKTQSPLIVVDPVDKSRNAAAALSKQKFSQFQKKAKEFLKNPSEEFFVKEEINLSKLKVTTKKNKQHLVYLELQPLEGKKDVVGAKLLKIYKFLKKELNKFKIVNSGWEWEQGNAKFYFLLKKNLLPKTEIRQGPPLVIKEHVKEFKRRNKDAYEENGHIMAKVKVKFPKLEKFFKAKLKDEYVKEKIFNVKNIEFS